MKFIDMLLVGVHGFSVSFSGFIFLFAVAQKNCAFPTLHLAGLIFKMLHAVTDDQAVWQCSPQCWWSFFRKSLNNVGHDIG